MKRRIILAGLAVFFTFSAYYAQKTPDWVKNGGNSRKYPSGLCLTGFGVSENNSLETRKGNAVLTQLMHSDKTHKSGSHPT